MKKKRYPILKIIGKELVGEGKFYSNASHPYWEIVYIISGEGKFIVDKKTTYSLCGGKIILVKPNVIHSSIPKNKGYFVYWLLIDYPNWGLLPSSVKSIEVTIQERTILETTLSILLKYFVLSAPEEIINNLLSVFISILKMEFSMKKIKKPFFSFKISPVSTKIINIIEENYNKPLRISDISSHLHLSSDRIMHIFKKEVGCSIKKYLIQYRVNMVKHFLLSNPSMPIKEIAHKTGFKNLNHFYLQFKRIVGISPSKYRQSQT